MLDQRRVSLQPDKKREQVFADRYDRLLACALRLTNQLRDAEDLVHDAFVQWVLGRTRIEEIENIDGYLRRMLRYMHISRISRSAQHLQETALSIADYDSFRLGWTAIEPPRRMQASEELHQICAYACSRKESSRAGSVLILRFFHDYFPIEIAGILNSSRPCVDQWQRLARREAKLSMNKPGRLSFVSANAPAERHPVRYLRSECDLMFDLRRMIFNSCHGDCLSQSELKEIYAKRHGEALTTRKLAHIVSCARCLDAVNGLLGLPLLAERYHAAPFESEDPPHDKTGGGGVSGSIDLTKRLARKVREIHEHKPHELRIAVNGFLVSSFKVSGESSELNLNLTPDEPAEFVEICSEQGLQLLFFSINPGGSQCEQWACIELSEGRSLEACFRNESGPSLHVTYKDPAAAEARIGPDMLSQKFLSSPLSVVSNRRKGFSLEILKGVLVGLARSRDSQVRETSFLTIFGQSHYAHRKHAWLGLLTALIAAAVFAGFLFFKASLEPAMTATALLEKASVAERIRDEVPDRVRHRLIDLEERRGGDGTIVGQRKIEIWESRASGQRSQRLYDGSNRLIAGVWQTASGSRIYHHGSKPQPQPSLASPDKLLLNLEDIWQLEPSAHAFGSFIAEPNVTGLEERPTTYVLRYENGRVVGASRLLKATLTLRKSDLHPVEQTLLVQRGSELREYRFVEVSFELVPLKAVAPAVFEIEPELTGGMPETGNEAFRDLKSGRVASSLNTSNPPIASAELEVDVAYLLNQVKADRNEQVALTRSAGGSLRVEGVVDTQQRKDEFLRGLGPVSNNRAVKIEIRTIEETKQRVVSATPVAIQQSEGIGSTVAADDELRAYFARNNPGGSTDEAIRSYSARMVNRGYRALFHAIELKRLVDRFANVDMRTVAPDARAKWVAMLREHVSAFARENAMLRQEIGPVFFPAASSNVNEENLIQSDADLARAVERLHKLALANNDAIRSAFTISAQSSAAAIKSAAFWQSLQKAEKLAERIRQYQATSN